MIGLQGTDRRFLACLALLAAFALAGAEARAATVADAGALRARVQPAPWGLELVDRAGSTVLGEHPGTGGSPSGTVGFRTVTGWEHATRVLESRREGDAYLAELETTDPARRLEVRIAPDGRGVVAFEARVTGPLAGVEAVGMGFSARDGERYLGFGERSNAVDQTGREVENYVADGPYQDIEYPVINLFVPRWGLRDARPEATYFPVPWMLSSAGYGVLVDNAETSLFRLGSDDAGAWSVEAVRAPAGELGAELAPPPDHLSLSFFAGPDPAGALRRFTRATGTQPRSAPWALGTWYQADDEELPEVELLREANAPLSVLQTYLHYLPCGDQVGRSAEQRERTAAAHAAGVAITTYVNPMICTNYQPAYDAAVADGALAENRAGNPYVYSYGADIAAPFEVSQFDFRAQAGRDHYAALLGEAIAHGYDGWMEDFGEYTPLDSVSAGGVDGTRAHNLYPTDYHCAAHEATRDADRPIVRYQRSGWTGAAACATVVWGGDPTTSWGFDGLRSAVQQALSAGLSGVGVWGSDIGGFFALGENRLTPELLTRWVQLGAVSPVMRTQANGVAVPSKDRPQVSDPDQIANWRRYTRLHTQLYPYLAAAERTYRRRGLPIMRHLALVSPGDPRAVATEDAFLFGPKLLAAPVLEPGVVERSVYLPRGKWIDLWRSVAYRDRSGALRMGTPETRTGGRTATVPAPLAELPLFVRGGTVLPLLPPAVETLAPYGDGPGGPVSLHDRRDRLRLLAFPLGRSRTSFYAGERLISEESRGFGWSLRIHGDRRRHYQLQAALGGLRRPFDPCTLSLDGRPLAPRRWSFDPATGVLRARFAVRRGELRVRPGGC